MTRFSTCGEESSQGRALLLHHTPLSLLRPHASWSKLGSAQVVQTVKPSTMATNMPSIGQCTRNGYHIIQNTSLFPLRHFELYQRGISTEKLKIYIIEGWKYCAKNECNTMITAPRRHKHPSTSANKPSYVAVTVNINVEFNLSSI